MSLAHLVEDVAGNLVLRRIGHPGIRVMVRPILARRTTPEFDYVAFGGSITVASEAKLAGATREREDGSLTLAEGCGMDIR